MPKLILKHKLKYIEVHKIILGCVIVCEIKQMKEIERVLNDLLVELFKDILTIEEKALRNSEIFDLTMREIHTIEAVGRIGSKTMGEIAENLRVTLGTLTTAVNRLVKKGYLIRKRDQKDRRMVYIKLSDSGKKAFDIHENFHSQMISAIVKDLKINEDMILVKSLRNIRDYFHKEYHKKWDKPYK